jgi:shikimate dehydrogenase
MKVSAHPAPVLLALIGQNIQRSRTPEMHMSEGEAHGLRLVYRLVDLAALRLGPEALPELLLSAERMGFDGLNITHPCKQSVIPHLHELSDDARALGAVNTVVLKGGRRTGHNTDWIGFAEPFGRHMGDVPLGKVVQLGAGGAGSAVAHAMLNLGAGELILFDADRERAFAVAYRLSCHFGRGRARPGNNKAVDLAGADGLINATPIGMDAHPGMPIDSSLLRPDLWVAELIYFPIETELLRKARAIGCRTIDGAGMAIHQAAAAFRLFTGLEPDSNRMEATFSRLGEDR